MDDSTRRYVEEQHRSWENVAATWYGNLKAPLELPALLPAISPGDRILDIGCASGWASRALAAQGARVVGIDFAASFVERARAASSDVEYLVCDACDSASLAQLDDRRFEGAVACEVLINLPVIEPVFAELRRILVPGGWFVFRIPHPAFTSPYLPPAGHLQRIRRRLARPRNAQHYLTAKAARWTTREAV